MKEERSRSLLQNLALGRLRISKVHHLIHKLVYDNEIVSYRLFLEFFEVLDEHLGQSVQKADDLCRIAVLFRKRKNLSW